MAIVYANRLRDLVNASAIPSDLKDFIGSSDGPVSALLDGLYFTDYSASLSPRGFGFVIDVVIPGELALSFPGIDDLQLVLGASAPGATSFRTSLWIAPDDFEFRLDQVKIALRFPPSLLKPVAPAGGGPAPTYAQLEMTTSLVLDRYLNVRIEPVGGLSLTESEIAGSGISVSATDVEWNFERGRTLPAAQTAGITGEFIGVAFRQATLKLPPEVAGAPQLTFDYCCIGTGGFSGAVQATPGTSTTWSVTLGGFTLDLERIALGFRESRLVMGEIEAVLRNVPLFDADVAVDLQLLADKGIRVAISAVPDRQTNPTTATVGADGLLTLRKPGVISMTLTSAALEVTSSGGSLRLSGMIQPEIGMPGGGTLPGFTVDALTIRSTGEVSVEGGWINLPSAVRVALGPFWIEITQAGMGSEASGERWIGFSGSVRLVEGVPITATVEGLKIRWGGSLTSPVVEFAGVGLSLTVPGVVELVAAVRYDRVNQRFDGTGSLRLISLNLLITVRCVIGRRADYTYLYLYLLVQPPVGVPIFNTGLALYAVEALYARHMAPDKKPSEQWFRDWYRRTELGAVDTRKWIDERDAQAFGAGVIVGTAADKGYSVGVKGLFIIIVPGPVLMLAARANLLKDPAELAVPARQALFEMLAVYDGRAGTLELGIEPHYVYPDTGELVDVMGIAEAFYSFNDPRAWHVYIGRRERERRIRAKILSIFEANFYLILEPAGLELGGFFGYDKSFSAGPARLALRAYIEGYAAVSWRPKQFKGNLHLNGEVSVSVAGVGLGLSASATVTAQAPQPQEIDATVTVRVDLPWPLDDLEASARLHWESPGPPRLTAPLQSVGIEHVATGASWPLGSGTPVVPLDGRLSLAFDRSVNDAVGVGTNAVAGGDSRVGDQALSTRLTGCALKVFDATLNDYVAFADPSGQPRELYGTWQAQSGDAAQGNRRLMLWVRTPYEWSRALDQPVVSLLEEAEHFSPCEPMMPTSIIDFESEPDRFYDEQSSWALRGATWSSGATPLFLGPVDRVQDGASTLPGLPKRYFRGLLIPNQFGYVAVTGTSTTTSSAGVPSTAQRVPLRITFPSDLKGISILALAASNWTLEAFDATGASLELASATLPPVHGALTPCQLTVWRKGIRRIDVSTTSRLVILAIAVQGAPTATEVATRRTAMLSTLERFKSEEPLLAPHRRYRLEVTTEVVETNGVSLETAEVEAPATANVTHSGATARIVQRFEFETQGPPGDTSLSPLGSNSDAVTSLDVLEPYVRLVLPPRGAPAVYRAYDVGVAFNADYADQMFRSNINSSRPNGQVLKIELRSDEGETVALTNAMGRGNESVLRREEKTWLKTLERSSCQLTIAESTIVRESVVSAQQQQGVMLEPRRQYEAVVRGDPSGPHEATKPLLRWTFVTSAYRRFADHFQLRGSERIALASAGTTWTQWAALLGPAIAAGDPWSVSGSERERRRDLEAAAFRSAFERIDAEGSLPPDLELHLVRGGSEYWAVLLSSPEPFDWERTLVDVQFRQAGGRPSPGRLHVRPLTRLIRDADGTRALIVQVVRGAAYRWRSSSYQLVGTYRRAPGGGLPTLSEQGQTADEQQRIDFVLP